MTRAVIYTRISVDREGNKESPEFQADLCRAFAEAKEWTVVRVLLDRGKSAADPKVRRDEYDEALRMLADDEADVLVAHKQDRLQRSSLAWGLLHKHIIDTGKRMVTADGSYDTDDESTMLMGQMLASVAEAEVRTTKARQRVATKARARDGRPHPGGHRTFGYTKWKGKLGMEIIESEANEIRRMADAVIAGESLNSLCTDLNDRGILTTAGKAWSVTTLGRLLRSGVIAGEREHLGERHDASKHWKPIITPTTSALVVGTIAENARGRETQARYLLSTTLRCGTCKGPMQGGKISDEKFVYRCSKSPGTTRCGKNTIAGGPSDELVVRLMFEHMKTAKPAEGRSKDVLPGLRGEREVELKGLQTFHRDRYKPELMIEAETAAQIIGDFGARIKALEAEIAAIEEEVVAIDVAGDVEVWWKTATLTEQRDLIRRQFKTLEVGSAVQKGRSRFQPDRILNHLEFR